MHPARNLLAPLAATLLACGSTARPGPDEVIPDLPGAEGCAGVPLVTTDQLASGSPPDGLPIAVDAVPVAFTGCEPLDCGPPTMTMPSDAPLHARRVERADCPAYYAIRIGDRFAELVDVPARCTVACNIDCEPFGLEPTRAYRFVGVFELAGDDARLRVHGACSLAD